MAEQTEFNVINVYDIHTINTIIEKSGTSIYVSICANDETLYELLDKRAIIRLFFKRLLHPVIRKFDIIHVEYRLCYDEDIIFIDNLISLCGDILHKFKNLKIRVNSSDQILFWSRYAHVHVYVYHEFDVQLHELEIDCHISIASVNEKYIKEFLQQVSKIRKLSIYSKFAKYIPTTLNITKLILWNHDDVEHMLQNIAENPHIRSIKNYSRSDIDLENNYTLLKYKNRRDTSQNKLDILTRNNHIHYSSRFRNTKPILNSS